MLLQGIQNLSEHNKGTGMNTVDAGTCTMPGTTTCTYSVQCYVQHPHANRVHCNLNYKIFQTEQKKKKVLITDIM